MQKRYIPLALFFVILLMLLTHFGARALAIPTIAFADGEEQKQVYLTFDDGPSTVVTSHILDTLKQENVKATFFIVGDRARSRKEILKRISDEGHTVAVHSNTHVYSEIYASDKSLLNDVDTCAALIKEVTGAQPCFYRFPGGLSNGRDALLNEHGYTVVRWNADSGDAVAKNVTRESILKSVKETSKGKRRVVLLMHDGAYNKATAEALPDIISYFRQGGYDFCAY